MVRISRWPEILSCGLQHIRLKVTQLYWTEASVSSLRPSGKVVWNLRVSL
jgi:hypothetical protein